MTNSNKTVFERFDINPGMPSVETVTQIHKVYHEILAALDKDKNSDDRKSLTERRDKVKADWLSNHDLDPEIHSMLDDTEELLLANAFDNGVEQLAATYQRIVKLGQEIKKHLDDQVDKIANPGNGRRQIIGTKAEAKLLRSTAQSQIQMYSVIRMMDDKLPEMPNLEWANVPPGRDVELTTTPYIGGVTRYSTTSDNWMSRVEFIEFLNQETNSRLTRHEFTNMLEEEGLSLHGDWTHTYKGVTFHQRRHAE